MSSKLRELQGARSMSCYASLEDSLTMIMTL